MDSLCQQKLLISIMIVKYPNLRRRQLVYVPICNGLLCSLSFLCNQTLSNIADMSAPPSPTLHQQTTSDSHNTPANAAMLIKQLTVTCSWEIFGLVVTDMQIHHDQIFRGLRTVVSRAVSVAPLGQLSWPLSHSATHFLNLSRLGIVGAHLMNAPSLC